MELVSQRARLSALCRPDKPEHIPRQEPAIWRGTRRELREYFSPGACEAEFHPSSVTEFAKLPLSYVLLSCRSSTPPKPRARQHFPPTKPGCAIQGTHDRHKTHKLMRTYQHLYITSYASPGPVESSAQSGTGFPILLAGVPQCLSSSHPDQQLPSVLPASLSECLTWSTPDKLVTLF